MFKSQRFSTGVLLISLITAMMTAILWSPYTAAQSSEDLGADAVVLVNSSSTHFDDFQHYIQPYLDNFGVPYTIVDVATTPVEASVSDRAVIIVGHRQLDPDDAYLDATEETHITNAVNAGTGLVNFDNELSADASTPRYQFVDDVFGFGYTSDPTGSGVTFTSEEYAGLRINCWEDDHQEPVLTTTESTADLVEDDGEWTEFLYTSSRDYPSILAGADEEDHGLPVLRCYDSGIPNGEYEVLANLYTSGSGRDMRYYYGFTPGDPKAYSVDTVGGAGGSDQHEEYSLGTVTITDGTFDVYAQDADILGGDYPYFGWAWIRLTPVDAPPPEMHYITERHETGESISTGSMTLADITLPTGVDAVAMTGDRPFLAVTTSGEGHAVQWGSYDWMSHSVLGPVYGLDDLVWRSIVWAARKPFVMQGMPPFITMRVDDESGPFWWIEIANEFDIKPWAGLFFHNIDSSEAEHLSSLVHAGLATTSIHAFNGGFFYYDHSGSDWPDDVMADHYAEGTQWHQDNDIPISKFVLPHYYEIGTNAFQGLSDWDVEFVGTQMDPGTSYGDPWLVGGPYRLYEPRQSSRYGGPGYYADFLSVPGHPEFDGEFFNCVTEIRDDAGYEWYPDNDVQGSIGRGTRQTKRALDSMVLATLFTHGQHVYDITQDNWRAILDGITSNLESYDPIYVTLDHGCQYARAMYTSHIADSTYNTSSRELTTTFGGETDMPTMFYLFTERDNEIQYELVDVPTFSGSTEVVHQIAGPLDHIVVSPDTAEVVTGADQQFSAEGYDADNNPIPNLSFTWDVVNGGGTIDADGLFTAGTVPGVYTDTVAASHGGTEGYATVSVVEPSLDHFTFEPIEGTKYVDVPFSVTMTARDASGGLLTTYDGQASLSDSTATISPTMTGAFSGGSWTGDVTIGQEGQGVTITAEDGAATGVSAAFDVEAIPGFYEVTSDSYVQTAGEPFTVTVTAYEGTQFYCADDDHQDPVLETFTDSDLFDDTDGEWDEFLWEGHRDYAGVFGGIPEALSGTLELMRFYAYVPDGTYRVIANLYHSRDWRYYYGYSPDNPRAYSIDVTSGPSGDFAEFDLGTVTVTDSLFELYTDYAEDLGGTTFEYFGWGWIRLEPVMADIQIDAWDDDHQDPVLTTTNDAGDLDETDGEWTEFHYVSGNRPYPSVMAGADEEDYGLPIMRFYADGISNGEYEVFANLYTAGSGRDMRYFYGYTSADPKAAYVDTVGGAGGTVEQHEEYSLGTVNIDDGTFDIYVQDADVLPSATDDYPFFGWAHIRLVSTGLTMSSSSPTMLFDGDGDGTFGETGDDIKSLVDGTFDIAARDTTADTGVSIVATDHMGQSGSNLYDILHSTAITLEITPAEETANAGQTVTYYAMAEDAYGNSWDVTAETTFEILETGHGGTWTGGSDYTTHTAGEWTVTADYDGLTNTALLHVEHADAATIALTPADATVTAGESVTYHVEATDAYSNTWDVTNATAFSIESGAGGAWTDNVYTSETAGDWTVTAGYNGLTDTALLHVEHAAAASIALTPDDATVTAGESATYHVEATDAYGNTWDVTDATAFSIESGAGGAWTDNVYTSETMGDWTVTAEHDGLTDTALLHVEHAAAASIALTPDDTTVTAGESATYHVEATDAYSNTWDVTDATAFSIESGAGGTWTDNVYTSETMGDWTVTAGYNGLTDTALLHVEHAAATSIALTPADATVTAGESATYHVEATDAYSNTWDVTDATAFSIESGAGGAWTDNVYTSETMGDWTVTAEHDGLTDTAFLHVEHAAAASIALTPADATVTAGESATYHVEATDAYSNTWDVTDATAFSIESGAGGAWTDNVYTSETMGDWTVTADYDGLTDTALLHVEPAIDLSITKTSVFSTVMAGETVTYTIVVTNEGLSPAENVTVTDQLPTELVLSSVIASQGTGCNVSDSVTCEIGSLASGTTATVTLIVTTTESGTFTNVAQVEGHDSFDNAISSGAHVDVDVINPHIQITKTGPSKPVFLGSDVPFTLTITNMGDVTLTDVQVEDPLVSTCDADLGTLAVGESMSYTCQALNVQTAFTNTATVTAITSVGSVVRDSDSASIIIANPALTVIKEASAQSVQVGDTLIYTYTVENTGNVLLNNVIATDDKLGTISLSQSDLSPSEVATGTAAYTVHESDLPGPLTNIVTVTATPPEGEAIVDTDTVTVEVSEVQPVPEPPSYQIFIPLVAKNHTAPAPDLVVENITVTSEEIQVIIKNQGARSVDLGEAFWVDAYIDPDPAPNAVNQTWPMLSDQGVAWGVVTELAVGEVLTLTINDHHYRPAESRIVWPLTEDVQVYVQVDSAHANTSYGGVLETHEILGTSYNNISGTTVTIDPAVQIQPVSSEDALPSQAKQLPPRPR